MVVYRDYEFFVQVFWEEICVYNVVDCHVIPVVCAQILEVKMQQSTKWMWMVEDVPCHMYCLVSTV